MNLRPCPYRRTDDDGHILCDKIKTGDREVNAATCRACPIAAINCAHLRATLEHHARPPLVVRWGNGKTEVWDDFAQASLTLTRAACAEQVTPITSVNDCAGCTLRQALAEREKRRADDERRMTKTAEQSRAPSRLIRRAPTPVAAPPPAPPPDARSSMVAQKIIQLQEWLAKQARAPQSREETEPEAEPPRRVAARVVGEEKRVGWTD